MRHLSFTMLVAVALLMASRAAAQQSSPQATDTNAITPSTVDAGRNIFHGKGTCVTCHGGHLEGTQMAPTLKAHAWRDAKNGQYDELYRVITQGVPSTAMVALPGGISPSEALAVAAYIWSVNNRKAKP